MAALGRLGTTDDDTQVPPPSAEDDDVQEPADEDDEGDRPSGGDSAAEDGSTDGDSTDASDPDREPLDGGDVDPDTSGPADQRSDEPLAFPEDHGVNIDADSTGPTAYHDPELGRELGYDDLEASGSLTTDHDGQVIERLDIDGHITIAHDDVEIRAVRLRAGGSRYAISYERGSDASGATLEYVEIDGEGDTEQIGVLLDDFVLRRSHIYGQRVGVQFGGGSRIEENYVHSQAVAEGSHNTAMSIHGGDDVVVRHNNLEGSTSAALSLYPRLEPLHDILVEGNLFNGGSFCTYAGNTSNHDYRDENRGIRFIGNVFGRSLHPECGQYGPVEAFEPGQDGNEWTGNVWLDGGLVEP